MTRKSLNIDEIGELSIVIYCISEECKGKEHEVLLILKTQSKWKEYEGYADPRKGFKETKIFARKTIEWRGTCEHCDREYDAMLRLSLGE
jgi:hypothetical protein